MAFLPTEKRPTTKQQTQAQQVELIVKAHGFDPGVYQFVPNNGVTRKEGSIANGTVKGSFIINKKDSDNNPIIFYHDDYPNEKQWHRVCATFGFKYHNINDIDAFVINTDGTIEVIVSIVTPTTEI